MKDFEIPTGTPPDAKRTFRAGIWHGRSSNLPGNPNFPGKLISVSR